jgi:hypothetical protein
MGELGTIRRYAYWSDRRIRSIAIDNGIGLSPRWRLGFKTPAFGLLPQVELTDGRTTLQRNQIALRLERAIGQLAVEDFVTPAGAIFAKGCGKLTFAQYTRWYKPKKEKREAIIIHTRTTSSNGSRVEVCLFGSIENCADYLTSSNAEAPMWSSSSTRSIEQFIANRGTKPDLIYDDDESMAVEILRTINNQGMTSEHVINRLPSAEWFAEVYRDVELDSERWNLRPGEDLPEPVDRIVIGAPLWVRSNGH